MTARRVRPNIVPKLAQGDTCRHCGALMVRDPYTGELRNCLTCGRPSSPRTAKQEARRAQILADLRNDAAQRAERAKRNTLRGAQAYQSRRRAAGGAMR